MDDKQALIDLVKRDALRFGDFTLASGKKSSYYLDCRKITLCAAGAGLVGRMMLRCLESTPFDAVGGLTLGADPIAGAVLAVASDSQPELRGFIVRKEAKQHGAGNLVEGPLREGDRCVVVEDTCTTGGSAQKAIEAVESMGCSVVHVVTVVDRLEGAAELFAGQGVPFTSLLSVRDLGIDV